MTSSHARQKPVKYEIEHDTSPVWFPHQSSRPNKPLSKPDLVNPSLEQRHREALAVALGNGRDFMAKDRPSDVLRAAGGAQSILRPMPQRMQHLARIDDA